MSIPQTERNYSFIDSYPLRSKALCDQCQSWHSWIEQVGYTSDLKKVGVLYEELEGLAETYVHIDHVSGDVLEDRLQMMKQTWTVWVLVMTSVGFHKNSSQPIDNPQVKAP